MLSGTRVSTNHFQAMMTALNQAPFTFYSTGSRCFGYHDERSDWDFFVGIPPSGLTGLKQWLIQNGFRKESNSDYMPVSPDPLSESLEVWIHYVAKIHVQIVGDAASKVAIQEAMKKVPGMAQMLRSLSKHDRKAIWGMGRAIFEAGRRAGKQS